MHTYGKVKFSGEYQAEIYYLNLQKKTHSKESD